MKFYSLAIFSSILSIIVLFILFSSLFIISIRLSYDRIITSIFSSAVTVAVLSSSLSKAISQKISPECNSAIFDHFIDTLTLPDFNIYHSQFDFSHSEIIISPLVYVLSLQFKMICSIISWVIHLNISRL
ncbi:MAG: hypothetical protein Q8S84_02230 [bacterium]|nr:hypothetical protein [bacterium]